MSRRGLRTTVERGIYRDRTGYEVVARVGRFTQARRFPADTHLRILRTWRDATVATLRADRLPTTDTGTIAGAVTRLQQIVTLDAPTSAALNAWITRHGTLQRRRLTPVLAAQAIEAWRSEGKSPQTLFYRRLAIEKLWRTLDGPKVATPVDDIHISRPRGKRPVWVSDETIRTVCANLEAHEQPRTRTNGKPGKPLLRSSKTRARFMVLATTGQRPSQMRRTKPADVDLARGIWWVRAAKGGEPVPVYLNSDMRAAWQLFIAAKAWGPYDVRNFARTLRRNGWPDGVRPYNLRHAAGLTLSERGTDLADIQSHMGHTSSATTRAFYVPQLHSRLKGLSATLEGRFGWGRVAPERGTTREEPADG